MNKKFSALVSVLAFITPGFLVVSTVSPAALAQSGGTGGSTGTSGGQGTQSDGNRMGNPASNPVPGSGGSGLDTDSNSNDITPRPGSMMENRDPMNPTQQRIDPMSPTQQRMNPMSPTQQMNPMSPTQQMNPMSPTQQQMNPMSPGFNDNRINIQPNTTDNNSPFNSAAPRVLDSGSLGNFSHYVSITSGERPINSMTIAIPRDVNAIDDIIITNSSGDRVAAETMMNDGRLTVNFNQPLSAGEDIRVLMSGVQINSPIQRDGGILEYFVDVTPQGFTQPIPLGYTRVIMRDRSDNNNN